MLDERIEKMSLQNQEELRQNELLDFINLVHLRLQVLVSSWKTMYPVEADEDPASLCIAKRLEHTINAFGVDVRTVIAGNNPPVSQ